MAKGIDAGWSQILQSLQAKAKEHELLQAEEMNARVREEERRAADVQKQEDTDKKLEEAKRRLVKIRSGMRQTPDLASIHSLDLIEVPSEKDDETHGNAAVVQTRKIDCSEKEVSRRKLLLEGKEPSSQKALPRYQQSLCDGLKNAILKGAPERLGTDIRVPLDISSTKATGSPKEPARVHWYALLQRGSTSYPLLNALKTMPMKNLTFKTKLNEALKDHLKTRHDNNFFDLPEFKSIDVRMKIKEPPMHGKTVLPSYKDVTLECERNVSQLNRCNAKLVARERAACRLEFPKKVLTVEKQCQDIYDAIRTNDATKEENGLWLELGAAASPGANSYKTRKFALLKQKDEQYTTFGDAVERFLTLDPAINPRLHEALETEEHLFYDAEEENVSTRAHAAMIANVTIWKSANPLHLLEWDDSKKITRNAIAPYFSVSSNLLRVEMETENQAKGSGVLVDHVIVGTFPSDRMFVLSLTVRDRFAHMAANLTTSPMRATAFGAFCVYQQLMNNKANFQKIIQSVKGSLDAALLYWYLSTEKWLVPQQTSVGAAWKGFGTDALRTLSVIVGGRRFAYNYWDLLRVFADPSSNTPTLLPVSERSPWSIFDTDEDLILEVVGSRDMSYVCVHPKSSLINDTNNYWYVLSVFNKQSKIFHSPVSHWKTYFNVFIQKFLKEVDPDQLHKIRAVEEQASRN